MNESEEISKKIAEAEKRVKELLENGDLKKIEVQERINISKFYENKSLNRLESARLIFDSSKKENNYSDFSEVVSAAYYAMYYIIHSFLAKKYGRKLREGVRGVHAITVHLILYYLIKTKQLEHHLYEEYCNALDTVAEFSGLNSEEFQAAAYNYAKKYRQEQGKRERFTYFVSRNAEEHHAQDSLEFAERFISTIREVMIR
jgi:uncharacterized protein (UPF0332 family)